MAENGRNGNGSGRKIHDLDTICGRAERVLAGMTPGRVYVVTDLMELGGFHPVKDQMRFGAQVVGPLKQGGAIVEVGRQPARYMRPPPADEPSQQY